MIPVGVFGLGIAQNGPSRIEESSGLQRRAVLQSIATQEKPTDASDRALHFSSTNIHMEVVKQTLKTAREILPTFGGVVSAVGESAEYAIGSVGTNLYVRRKTESSLVASRAPLVLRDKDAAMRKPIFIWAEPRKTAGGTVPACWQAPSATPTMKMWLANLLSEIVGCKVLVINSNQRKDGDYESTCRIRTGLAHSPFASAKVTSEGIELKVSTYQTEKRPHAGPRTSQPVKVDRAPIVFPPGLGRHHDE